MWQNASDIVSRGMDKVRPADQSMTSRMNSRLFIVLFLGELFDVITCHVPFSIFVQHGGNGFDGLAFVYECCVILKDNILAVRRARELSHMLGFNDLPVGDIAECRAERTDLLDPCFFGHLVFEKG